MTPPATPISEATESLPTWTLTDDDIALSHSIYFSWGYPDYIRQAFRVLQRLQCEFLPADPTRELTWRQLRKALETADAPSTRFLVAGSPDTPINVLDYLSKVSSSEVVRRVAENDRAHVATLKRLATHSEPAVRMAVSENPHTPEGTLLMLAQDENPDVRYIMAENPNIPITILEVLSIDENPYVSDRARATFNRLTKNDVVVADFSRVARRRINRVRTAAVEALAQ